MEALRTVHARYLIGDGPMTSPMTFEALIMLLGDRGLSILEAIQSGASDTESIQFFSGQPVPCIETRIPALLDLRLIKKVSSGYVLDARGKELLDHALLSCAIIA